MALVVESKSEAGWNSEVDPNPTLVMTKPTGLAEGELMVMCAVQYGDDASVTLTLTGWTSLQNPTSSGSATSATITIHALYKIASAADAAASDFTFSSNFDGTGQQFLYGTLLRISGNTPTGNIKSTSGTDLNKGTGSASVGSLSVTPDYNNSLVIAVLGGADLNNGTGTWSAITINGTNPTWTEQTDTSTNQASDGYFLVATATQAAAAQITTLSATLSVSAGDYVGIVVTAEPQLNASVTLDALALTATVNSPTATGGANVTLDQVALTATPNDVTAAEATPKWSNTDKSATSTFTNTDKS